jgi:hypothetical protein
MYPNDMMRAYSNDIQHQAQERASNARLARQIRATRRAGRATFLDRVSLGWSGTEPEHDTDTDTAGVDAPGVVPLAERYPVWHAIVRGLGRAAGPA